MTSNNPCTIIGTKGIIAYDENSDTLITHQITANKLETTEKTDPQKQTDALGEYLKKSILDLIYPIGSIYTTTDETKDPTNLFGGTWINIKDVFLYGADPSNPPTSENLTGGSATHTHTTGDHTLTVNEMPTHGHAVAIRSTETAGGYDYIGHWNWYISYLTDVSRNGSSPPMLYIDWDRGNLQTTTPAALDTGGNAAHNHGDTGSASNLPPYRVVYIYERTA